jgi:integrase/recombinase XerD
MKLSKAMEGFVLNIRAEGYSPATIVLYKVVLTNLSKYLKNPEVNKIKLIDLTSYMVYLRDEYKPRRFGGNVSRLSDSSIQNHWKGIRAFFNWASVEFRIKNRPDEKLKLPPNNPKVIQPYTKDEIKAIFDVAEFTKEATTNNRKSFKMKRPTASRDLALMLFLLDTGLRVGEVGRLNVKDVDMQEGSVYIEPYGSSQRKTKSRIVYIGKTTKKALWSYLSTRDDACEEPLFTSTTNRRLDGGAIRHLLSEFGKRTGIANCHPHRFRHTFALEFLRNGGDVFSLQRLLGHSTLEMVQTYLQLADADSQNAHRKASPADHWRF